MRPPRFWSNPPSRPGWQSYLLAPLGTVYATGTALRVRTQPKFAADVPVICVGNLNVGGTGKTPTVIALIERLRGHIVHVVSRGYGGSLEGPIQVEPRKHSASEVGDEPLLLSAFAPTWISKDRAAGAAAAQANGAEVIILDDGFQNPTVKKSLSIVVVDAKHGFGNGKVLPAGPLRESVSSGLARADLLLTIGNTQAQSHFTDTWRAELGIPRATAQLKPLETGMDWVGQRMLAFAGIGHPEKFFGTLRELGADLVRAQPLSDHQELTDTLLRRLEIEAAALSAQLVTTEKDAVRLPKSFQQKVLTLPVRLELSDAQALDVALKRIGL